MIKKITTILAATALTASLFIFSVPGTQASASTQAKVNASILNIREKPGTTSKVLGTFKKGQVITAIQQQNGWTRVSFSGKNGWVSSKYLLPVKAAAKTPAKPATVTKPATYYVTAIALNIRKAPGTSSTVLTTVKKGEAVTFYEKKVISGKSWGRVKTASGKMGWASLSYLTSKAPAKPASKPAPKPKPEPEPSTPTAEPDVKYYVTGASALNIRKEPSTSSSVVTAVKKGEAVTFFEKKVVSGKSWARVKTASGKTGWASMSYLSTKRPPAYSVSGKTIVIDPGHGGSDPGAIGKGKTQEKTINLQTANELKLLLQNAGAKVIMTRTSNTSRKLELSERVAISHKYKADVFISIHYNSASDDGATGIDTFYDKTYGNEAELAKSIQTELIKQTGMRDRGVKTAGFYVVKYNKVPSVLVELGFISNPNEEKLIATKAYQQKAARGIFNGLNKYFD
ncbi:N-acetylmuramoyl-L-alanine amidase [Peribacillus glennii]|uniref:N-acetylmuramoyl-L-alanine amidase n=1 Tax=Peribacillus glennii TaxID=2303991 RepID=A0A372LDX4_9BACI|nr:N-acetylmuramoyl-L-alanine amidase [Peribacillus glennii]RFU63908.1 hypothetical protein D0466_10665 [Peribacillus glennii]